MKETFLKNLHDARVRQGRALARLNRSRRRGDEECIKIDHETLRLVAEDVSYWASLIREFCR